MIERAILLLFPILIPLFGISQDWVGLDGGLECFYLGEVRQLVPDESSGKLYAFGTFQEDSKCNPMRGIAVWDGVKWDSLIYVNGLPAGNGFLFNDTLYSTGHFDTLPLNQTNFVSKWNGTDFDSLPGTTSSPASDFTVLNDELYFCGPWENMGPDSISIVARYDGSKCQNVIQKYNLPSGSPTVIEMYDGDLYIGGQLTVERNGDKLSDLLKVSADTFEVFHPMFEGIGAAGHIQDLTVFQGNLYVAGSFSESDGYGGNNIMYWDGTSFHPCGSGTNRRVKSMTQYNGELYCAGWFTEAGGQEAFNIAKWDGFNWYPINLDSIEFYFVSDIVIWNDELYISGGFQAIGEDSIARVAKFNHPLRKGAVYGDEPTLTIYPNPAQNNLNLDFNVTSTDPLQITIIDMQGKICYANKSSSYPIGLNSKAIDITNLSAGLFVVRLNDGAHPITKKFIVP